MSSIEQQRYTILHWRVLNPILGGIPENGFKLDSELLITRPSGAEAYDLDWLNEPREECSIRGLGLDGPQPAVEVIFGNLILQCWVDLKYSGDFLKGTLTHGPQKGDGNAGIFIAEIDPPLSGEPV